jgi:crotonobetainyl-CoA:carnitine CoA-transferase CaiB-like acyl-CoA transferase
VTDLPLDGIRVVDLTSVIMGPFATHILADFGADVIKVESPDGDLFRGYKPLRSAGMGGGFLNLNRNKRSMVLDLKQAADREALDRLIATAEVFVHALRPKAIARLGYTYERVRALRPDVVYCGAYGFGAAGPYGDKAAYDDLIQAGAGIAALYTELDGAPRYVPTALCDKLGGQAIAYAILAALVRRGRTGEGEQVEVPMFETAIEWTLVEHFSGFAFEPPIGKPGFVRLLNPARKPYRTSDGYACILPYSDQNWRDFYAFTGRTEFADDPRYAELAERVLHIEALYRVIEEEAPKRATAEWVQFCDDVSIPCMPVLALEDLPEDQHVKAVELFRTMTHPTEGRYRAIRSPIVFGGRPSALRRHAPRLGEHTDEILTELGIERGTPAARE